MDPRGRVACPKLIDRNNRLQSQKKGFLDAIGNLGQLEALNEVGLGNVRQGLAAIAAAANQVRGQTSVVPGNEGEAIGGGIFQAIASTPFEAVEAGATIVLDATGIGRQGLDIANNVNASVANRALGAAKQIFQRAKQGNFTIADIPTTFQDLQNLESLVRGIFPGGDRTSDPQSLGRFPCQPSPYALDLIQRAPRFKFMYMVDIKFTPAYAQYNGIAAGMAFITKSSTRPQVDFEYEEVNMYNYRTQVIKRTMFQPMTMRFIDDQTGTTMRFYELYIKSLSPIANMQPASPSVVGTYEEASMDFNSESAVRFSERLPISQTNLDSDQTGQFSVVEQAERLKQAAIDRANNVRSTIGGFFDAKEEQAAAEARNQTVPGGDAAVLKTYASSVGALNPSADGIYAKNLIQSISLYHIGNYGDSITVYTMYNPKITSLQPDEVNMADNGDGSELQFEFTYDALHVMPNVPMDDFGLDRLFGISGGNVGATYPLLPIGTGENREAGTAENQLPPIAAGQPGADPICPVLPVSAAAPSPLQATPGTPGTNIIPDGNGVQTFPVPLPEPIVGERII